MTTMVKEGSALFLTFTFKDENGAPVAPITIDWRIDDVDSGTEVVGWTPVGAPSASVNVSVNPTNNNIVDQTKVVEKRILTVRMDNGQVTQAFQTKHFRVQNLYGAP
jgi:hypothetical protein